MCIRDRCDDSAAVCDVCVTNINNTSDDDLLLRNGCAVITDCDSDFGDIHKFQQCEKKTISLPSQKINPQQIAHFTPDERQDLLNVLDKYAKCFFFLMIPAYVLWKGMRSICCLVLPPKVSKHILFLNT